MEPLTPERVLPALVINVLLAVVAWKAGSVRPSGAVTGLVLGSAIYVCMDLAGFLVLALFFVLGSSLTKIGYRRKLELGAAEANAGARGAGHALANAGVPALLALAWAASGHAGLPTAFAAAFATAAMDTAGSEVGPLTGGPTLSLKTLRPVPAGTPGGVSAGGTIAGLASAALVGGAAWGLGVVPAGHLPAILLGAAGGNLYEGILGARGALPHGWLNATNTLVGAAIAWLTVS